MVTATPEVSWFWIGVALTVPTVLGLLAV